MLDSPAVSVTLAVVAWLVLSAFFPAAIGQVTHFLVRTPATLTHEFSHAFTAAATGGLPTGLRVTSATSASVRSVHFTAVSRALTPAAGYVMTPLIGLLMVLVTQLGDSSALRAAPIAFLIAVSLVCLLLSRNLLALCASLWLLAVSSFLFLTPLVNPVWVGLGLVLVATADAARLLRRHLLEGRGFDSDATALPFRLLHPALISGVWMSVSCAALGCSVLVIVRTL